MLAERRKLRPDRPTRTYTLAPEWAAGIREPEGRKLAEGMDATLAWLEGKAAFPLPPPDEPAECEVLTPEDLI